MKNIYVRITAWLAGPFSSKISKFTQNAYVMAIQNGFQTVLPMILVGSIASLINTLRNFWEWVPDLSLVNQYSFGLIGIFLAFILPYNIMENKKQNRAKLISGFTGVSVLLALCNPVFKEGNISLNAGYIGTGGMTVGLLVGLLIGAIFAVYFKHGLFSKDTSLPSIVVNWFESIVPVFLVIGIAILIAGNGVNLFDLMEEVVSPIAAIGNTYLGFVLLYFIMALCYSLGLSAWAVYPIFLALALNNIAANIDMVAAGKDAVFITTVEVVFCGWCCMGGMGCTMPLNIQMLRSKSKKINAIGKAAIFPSLFNINEPVMYGLPVVWNPIMMIPYLLVSFIVPSLVYLVLTVGFVDIPARAFQMNFLPQPVATFLTNYDFRGVIFWILLFILIYLIYLPFFKVYENQEMKKEAAEEGKETV